MRPDRIAFTKGHGTGNDFVIVDDVDSALTVTPGHVVALCDRRRGIGADGLLVVRRTANHREVADQRDVAEYFMDYRNADGSVAEMCGNGARVFAAHLVWTGLVSGPVFHIATRGGSRRVDTLGAPERIVVAMGMPEFTGGIDEIRVAPAGGSAAGWPRPAVGMHLPNPHAVTWVDALTEAGSLRDAPEVTPAGAFPAGVNVEFVEQVSAHHVRMRVFERGVGETLSCGTGACAAAVAALRRQGLGPGAPEVRVDVPGGTLGVHWRPDGSVDLRGPAELVATGVLATGWWERHG
jgi:diaminopimelate epimerase